MLFIKINRTFLITLWSKVNFQGYFAWYLYKLWIQKDLAENFYEQALDMEPRIPQFLGEYAEFVWTLMGDEEKEEFFFNAALQENCNDPTIRGSYALFMWRRER